jgi:hypothetical protein
MDYGLFNLFFVIKDVDSLDVNLRGFFSFSNDIIGTLESTLRGYMDCLS